MPVSTMTPSLAGNCSALLGTCMLQTAQYLDPLLAYLQCNYVLGCCEQGVNIVARCWQRKRGACCRCVQAQAGRG